MSRGASRDVQSDKKPDGPQPARGSVLRGAAILVEAAAAPEEFTDERSRTYIAGVELGRGVLTTVRAAVCARGEAMPPALAIKTVLPLWIGHPLAEARIARERELSSAIFAEGCADELPCARILAGGRQECGQARSRPFHVTRQLAGRTWAEQLREGHAPSASSLREALAWADDLLRSLARVHAVGWVHRDVKPQNVFLSPAVPGAAARAWLIDFGLALPIGASRGDTDEPFGTPAYVSPEVIAGATVDPRADLYSVGLILFEVLAGRRPYPTRDPIALLDAHLSEPAPRLRSVLPSCSDALDRVIAATLGKDPADRPASADELRSLLASTPEAADAR